MTRREAQAKFARAQRDTQFCPRAHRAVRGKTLPQAWQTCRTGEWMAWWLFNFTRSVSVDQMIGVACDHGCSAFVGPNGRRNSRQFADALRREFNYDGTRRTTARQSTLLDAA